MNTNYSAGNENMHEVILEMRGQTKEQQEMNPQKEENTAISSNIILVTKNGKTRKVRKMPWTAYETE